MPARVRVIYWIKVNIYSQPRLSVPPNRSDWRCLDRNNPVECRGPQSVELGAQRASGDAVPSDNSEHGQIWQELLRLPELWQHSNGWELRGKPLGLLRQRVHLLPWETLHFASFCENVYGEFFLFCLFFSCYSNGERKQDFSDFEFYRVSKEIGFSCLQLEECLPEKRKVLRRQYDRIMCVGVYFYYDD